MEPTRDEARLIDVRDKIEALYMDRGDDFNLPARYEAFLTLETILLEKVKGPLSKRLDLCPSPTRCPSRPRRGVVRLAGRLR
jgi:hypothetical protein